MEIELWTLFDALMKWVIIPVAAVLWVHNQKLGSHEKEVLRIMTLLAERKDQRDEDRAELKEALRSARGHPAARPAAGGFCPGAIYATGSACDSTRIRRHSSTARQGLSHTPPHTP